MTTILRWGESRKKNRIKPADQSITVPGQLGKAGRKAWASVMTSPRKSSGPLIPWSFFTANIIPRIENPPPDPGALAPEDGDTQGSGIRADRSAPVVGQADTRTLYLALTAATL